MAGILPDCAHVPRFGPSHLTLASYYVSDGAGSSLVGDGGSCAARPPACARARGRLRLRDGRAGAQGCLARQPADAQAQRAASPWPGLRRDRIGRARRGRCEAIVAPPPVRVAAARFALPGSGPMLEGGGELRRLRSCGPAVGVQDPRGRRLAADDRARRRLRLPGGGSGSRRIPLERYGLPALHDGERLLREGQREGRSRQLPRRRIEGWDLEAALDEDMASAACPECHILMVEGKQPNCPAELGAAVDTAAKLGATEISNSYGYPERLEDILRRRQAARRFDRDYEHPGVVIFASAGDTGYEDTYERLGSPAIDFPGLLAGRRRGRRHALYRDRSVPRGWREEVWDEPRSARAPAAAAASSSRSPPGRPTRLRRGPTTTWPAVAAVETGVSVRIDGQWNSRRHERRLAAGRRHRGTRELLCARARRASLLRAAELRVRRHRRVRRATRPAKMSPPSLYLCLVWRARLRRAPSGTGHT